MDGAESAQWLVEMEEARKVQSGMLPQTVPTIHGYDLAARLSPALNVGGDFYDFTALPDGRVSLIVGDAVGHGISAALLMAVALTNYRYVAPLERTADGILNRLDQQLNAVKTESGHSSVTATCCVLDPDQGKLWFSLAAMQPILVRNGRCTRLETQGMRYPLGIVGQAGYGSSVVALDKGDVVLVFSDGIPEATGPNGELYGFGRLEEVARLSGGLSAQDVVDAILTDLQSFVGDRAQDDDITLVVLRREAVSGARASATTKPMVLANEIALRSIFQEVLSPAVIDRLIAHPSEARLDGAERDLSVLFTDLRGFTEFMAAIPPDAGMEAMRRYFNGIVGVILQNDGMLDKTVGDEVMALFGVPVDIGNHAANACRAALESARWLAEYNRELRAQGFPELRMGVGVNSGTAWVGMMGYRRRMGYTPWGDNINFGARLEGTNKTYGTEILIGESTRERAGPRFVTREVDRIAVRGDTLGPVQTIYELVAKDESDIASAQRETLRLYGEGLAAYRSLHWDAALQRFQAALEASGGTDGPSRLFIDRTTQLRARPPAQPWDGVFRTV